MPNRDTAQLILEVDARIATAQRAVNQLARSIQQDATGINSSLKSVEVAQERVGRSLGSIGMRSRAGFTQLSFQIGDISQGLAMGTKASTIFAQQSGQVIQALQVMGGEGNKFLQFIGGPWGIALSTATVLLSPLIAKLLDTGDETEKLIAKMREQARQAEISAKAEDIWSHSLDGLIDRQKKLSEQLRDRLKNQTALQRAELNQAVHNQAAAQNTVTRLEADPNTTAADLAKAQKLLTNTNRDLVAAQVLAGRQLGEDMADLTSRAKTWADRQADIIRAIQTTHPELSEPAPASAMSEAYTKLKKAIDAAASAGVDFNKTTRETDDLNNRLQHGTITVAAYSSGVNKLATSLAAAAKAAQDAKKATGGTGELANFIMPASGPITSGFGSRTPPTKGASSFHPAIDIGGKIGDPIKAAAAGVVIYTGKMGGLGNVVIVDHGGGTITEYGHLSSILTKKGSSVDQGDVIAQMGNTGISTGPHLDYRVKVGGKYVDPRKGRFAVDTVAAGMKAGNSAESEEDKALRRQNAFTEEAARLDQDLIRAKTDLVQGTDAQAEAATAALQAEQARLKLGYDNDVKEGKLSAANAELLKAKVDQIAFEKAKAIELQRSLENMRRADDREQRSFQYQADDLRFADEMARTQAEHRRYQLEILDVVYQQKEAHLRALKAELVLAGKIEEAADVQAQIDRLPTDRAQDTSRTLRGTMNPIEAWGQTVPQTANDVIEALQRIEADGLEGLTGGLADAGMKFLGLADQADTASGRIVRAILEMIAKMLIFRAISAAFGGGGSTIDLGPLALPSTEGVHLNGARAIGGRVMAGGNYLVGEKGSEVFSPDRPGMIIPNPPNIGAGFASGNRAPIELIIHSAPSEDAWAKVDAVSAHRAGEAVKLSVSHTNNVIRGLGRPRLNGR